MSSAHLRQLDANGADLVVAYYPMVQRIARRTRARLPAGVDVDELVSVGVVGLIEAVERYDPARGIPFEAYAKHRVQGAILDSLRASDWVPRAVRLRGRALESARRALTDALGRSPTVDELAAKLETTPEIVLSLMKDAAAQQPVALEGNGESDSSAPIDRLSAEGEDPERVYARKQLHRSTAAATAMLPEREKTAIELFYFQERSLKEIGLILGVSESRVSQLCSQGIRRLRELLDPPAL
jgi:RNA polymerase sigma factor for flagellar operon FliA